MRKLRLKNIFELPHEYKEYEFLNCSFDFNGNPNILLKKGGSKNVDDDDLPTLNSVIPIDYLLIIISKNTGFYQLNNTYFNYNYAFKANDGKYLFACSYCTDDDGLDYDKNCKFLMLLTFRIM